MNKIDQWMVLKQNKKIFFKNKGYQFYQKSQYIPFYSKTLLQYLKTYLFYYNYNIFVEFDCFRDLSKKLYSLCYLNCTR